MNRRPPPPPRRLPVPPARELEPSETTLQVEAIEDPAAVLAKAALDKMSEAAEGLREVRARRTDSDAPNMTRILIVDDDLQLLRLLRKVLLPQIDVVDVASNMSTALQLTRERAYKLLIVDFKLVNGTALQLIQKIRAGSRKPMVYIILCSGALTPQEGPDVARRIGANDFIAKPINLEYLQGKVLGALSMLNRYKLR